MDVTQIVMTWGEGGKRKKACVDFRACLIPTKAGASHQSHVNAGEHKCTKKIVNEWFNFFKKRNFRFENSFLISGNKALWINI